MIGKERLSFLVKGGEDTVNCMNQELIKACICDLS